MQETKKSMVGIVLNGMLVAVKPSIREVEEFLSEHFEEAPHEVERANIRLLNIIGDWKSSSGDFSVQAIQEDPFIGDAYQQSGEEILYEVEETGYTCEDEDDLKVYLEDLIRDGEYTADEVASFDITQRITQTINFEDATSGEFYVELFFEDLSLEDIKGIGATYQQVDTLPKPEMPSKEVIESLVKEKMNNMDVVNLKQDVEQYTNTELYEEIHRLRQRLLDLQLEQRRREA